MPNTALHLSVVCSHHSSQSGYDAGSYASALGESYLNNGGGQRHEIGDDGNLFMMFSPAEHADSMKRRKEKKRRERREQRLSSSGNSTLDTREKDSSPANYISPSTTSNRSTQQGLETPVYQESGRIVSPTFWPDDSPSRNKSRNSDGPYSSPKASPSRGSTKQESPSRPPLHRAYGDLPSDEDDVWYAKWWTFCFPDALDSTDPKR
jgi:hypothetical protein